MLIDQDMARLWADHHVAFSGWVNKVAHDVGEAFRVLARVQYDRPWEHEPRAQQAAPAPANESGCTRH